MMNTTVVPPVPKPRTRLNVVKSVKPQNQEVIPAQIGDNSSVDVYAETNVSSTSTSNLYPFKEAGLDEYKRSGSDLDVKVPTPGRPAPPTPRSPPIGWNVDPQNNTTRVAPPPPGNAPKLLRKESLSPVYYNTEPARQPSAPNFDSPPPPHRNDSSNATVSNEQFFNILTTPSNLSEKEASRVIENSAYMSLEQFRHLASSSTATSGFCSLGSPVSPRRNVESVASESRSSSPLSVEPTIEYHDDPAFSNLSTSILDLKLPSSNSSRSSVCNTYTPTPKMVNFLRKSLTNSLQDFKEDERPISLQESNEVEICGTAISFFGFVSIHVGKKERKKAHARLKDMNLSFHEDDETNDLLSGPFHIPECQIISREDDVIYIRLNEMEAQKSITFTVESFSDTWTFLLGECWVSDCSILKGSVKAVQTCGMIWLRHGSAAEWQLAICCFAEKSFQYVIRDSPEYIYELDLRKVLGVRERVNKCQWCPRIKKKTRGAFMLTLDGCSLYFECEDETCTNKWFDALNKAICATPSNLDEYRLTSDNVPMIVDKCIRFISVYGMSSEGIYRRNGKISEAKDIMNKLLEDPAGTHLLPATDETVYAVADVLRQFFRKLPTPLFPVEVHSQLFDALTSAQESRTEEFRKIIHTLPCVYLSTLRKLMSHLKEVSNNCGGNKASFDNLAKVFGPSLFHTDSESEMCFKDNSKQISVIATLIVEFDKIFELTMREELSRVMLESAKKAATPQNKGRANGLLIPIHLWERENISFNVQADLAAEEVCREAVAKRGFTGSIDGKYAIYEVLRDSCLRRKLHPAEKLSEIVVNRWIPWNCSDGFLLFDHEEPESQYNDITPFSGKVKIAEPGTKTFKSCELKVERGEKVIAVKGDKNWKEWDLHGLVWYSGAEACRKAPYPNSSTFFVVNSTNYRDKMAGFCVSFKHFADRTKFLFTINFIQTGGQPTPLVHI